MGRDHRERGLQRGDQEGIVLQEQLDGLVVQENPVFHGSCSGAQGVLDPGGTLRVGHHVGTLCAGLGHDDLDLVRAELRVLRIVVGGQHTARGADLDLVCTGPQDLAGLAPHAVGTVGHAVGAAGVRRKHG